MAPTSRAALISEIRVLPKRLRDKSMDCIFPPHHKHEFVNAQTRRRTSALAAERKDDQILRMETATGGETGGEWMSTTWKDEPDSGIVATVGIGGSACIRTSAR